MPLMRATFAKSSTTGLWRLRSIAPIPVGEIPEAPWRFPAPSHRESLRAARPGRPRGPQQCSTSTTSRFSIDDDERSPPSNREALEAVRAGRACERLRRRVLEPRRLRPHRRVRRAVHPRDDRRQPSHLSLRAPGAGRGARRHRRPRVDHPLRQQGLSGRARETARVSRSRRRWSSAAARRPTRSSASSACRAC